MPEEGAMSSDCKNRLSGMTCNKNTPPVFTKKDMLRSQKKRTEGKNRY